MDVRTLQSELKTMGLYAGPVDGIYGDKSDDAVEALLMNQGVAKSSQWSDKRQQVAGMQLVARLRGIEVGTIDGLAGPQTRHAFDVYDARAANGWKPVHEVEGWRGDSDETTPAVPPTRPLPKIETPAAPRVASPRQSRVREFYGEPGSGQVTLTLPFAMRIAWDLDKTVRSFSCHRRVREALEFVWKSTLDHYGMDRIRELRLDLYGGCLNVRKMRGGSAWSMHSWGIAQDVDPERNALKMGRDKATLDAPEYDAFWSFVYASGAISLGRERNYDWMHFQYATI